MAFESKTAVALGSPEQIAAVVTYLASLPSDTREIVANTEAQLRADPKAYLVVTAEGALQIERIGAASN